MSEDQMYEKGLGFAYWFITNKLILRKLLILFLIILIITIEAVFLFTIIYSTIVKQADYQQMIIDLNTTPAEYAVLQETGLPQEIQIGITSGYATNQGFDVISEIINPNQDWWAEFEYQFNTNNGLTEMRKDYILPTERKKLLGLNIDAQSAGNLVLQNVVWHKQINYQQVKALRYNFNIDNIQLIDQSAELGQQTPISRLSFELTNNSAFNYRDVIVKIFINAGNQVSAINQISTANLHSGEKRTLDITFFQNISFLGNTEIIPEVNFLDEKQILKIE